MKNIIFFMVALGLMQFSAQSQKRELQQADSLYADYAYPKAKEIYIKYSNTLSDPQKVNLAMIYKNENDLTSMVRWLSAAEKNQYPEAFRHLGSCYMTGSGVGKDTTVGLEKLFRAIALRDYEAYITLGTSYLPNGGLSYSLSRAKEYFLKAYEYGQKEAGLWLGSMESDAEKGYKYLQFSFNKGSFYAAYLIGKAHAEGRGVVKNRELALYYFSKCREWLPKDPKTIAAMTKLIDQVKLPPGPPVIPEMNPAVIQLIDMADDLLNSCKKYKGDEIEEGRNYNSIVRLKSYKLRIMPFFYVSGEVEESEKIYVTMQGKEVYDSERKPTSKIVGNLYEDLEEEAYINSAINEWEKIIGRTFPNLPKNNVDEKTTVWKGDYKNFPIEIVLRNYKERLRLSMEVIHPR